MTVADRIAKELPPGTLAEFSGSYQLFEGTTPDVSRRIFWEQAIADPSAERVAESNPSYYFSSAPNALQFDRFSFANISDFKNTRTTESFLSSLTPANWARFLDASYRARVVESFREKEVPLGAFSLREIRKKLAMGREAVEITHPTLGKVIVVRDSQTHQPIVFLASSEQPNLLRLFVPSPPGMLQVVRSNHDILFTDLVAVTVEQIQDGQRRLAAATPVIGESKLPKHELQRMQAIDAAWKAGPLEQLRERELRLKTALAYVQEIKGANWLRLFRKRFVRDLPFLSYSSAVAAIPGLAISGLSLAFPGNSSPPPTLGLWISAATVGLWNWGGLHSLVQDTSNALGRRRRYLLDLARWDGKIANIENEIVALKSPKTFDDFRGKKLSHVLKDFEAGTAVPAKSYLPAHSEFKEYWRTEYPDLMERERLLLLSIFQQAESVTQMTPGQREELVKILRANREPLSAAKAARDWLNNNFPLSPLITLRDLR